MNEMAKDLGNLAPAAIEQALELDAAGRGRRGKRVAGLAAIVAATLLAALAWGYWLRQPAAIAYRTQIASIGDMVIEVSATGTLNPVCSR